ncbi:MAG: nitroreductase [Bacteroidaceae bacterium]|nr:nitroreductase [Bacteroidaceae bacterium]
MKITKTIAACLLMAALTACTNNAQKENAEAQTAQTECQRNKVIENIMARRSIRKYKNETVDRQTLMKIMECGINSPNGQNKQSWEVRIVDKHELMEEIKETMAKGNPGMDAEMVKGCFRGAPVMVFIARDTAYDFSAYDCGLMAQNIMLSAQSLGVGSICLGSPVRFINQSEACAPVLEKLGFSKGYELSLCVGLGYADEAPAAKPRDMGKVKFVE